MSNVTDLRSILRMDPNNAFDGGLSRNQRLPFWWMGPRTGDDCGLGRPGGSTRWQSAFTGVATPWYHLRTRNASLVVSGVTRTYTGHCGTGRSPGERDFSMQIAYAALVRGRRLRLTETDDRQSLNGRISARDDLSVDGVTYEVRSALIRGTEEVTLIGRSSSRSDPALGPMTFTRVGALLVFSGGGSGASPQGREFASILNEFEAGYRDSVDSAVRHRRLPNPGQAVLPSTNPFKSSSRLSPYLASLR